MLYLLVAAPVVAAPVVDAGRRHVSLRRTCPSGSVDTPKCTESDHGLKMLKLAKLARKRLRRLHPPPLAVPIACVIFDKLLTGPKELKKVDPPVFAGLKNA